MYLIELIIISLGLSSDAFAVSICTGLTMDKVTVKKAIIVGLYFGIFQAVMPIIGYLSAVRFSDRLADFSTWIAFALLSFLGLKAIIGAFRPDEAKLSGYVDNVQCAQAQKDPDDKHHPNPKITMQYRAIGPKKMLPLAVATSIDALAVGVTFAFLYVDIIPAVSLIGIVTFVVSVIGVKIGNIFGIRFKSKAEIFGGLMLIGVGVFMLV